MQLEDLCCYPESSSTLLLSRLTAVGDGEEHLPLDNQQVSTPPPQPLPCSSSYITTDNHYNASTPPPLNIHDELSEYVTGIVDLRIKETKGHKYKDLSQRRLHQMMVRKSRSLKDNWDELPVQVKHASRSWVERYVAPVTRTYESSTDDKTTTVESRRAAVHTSRTLWDALVGSQVSTNHLGNTRSTVKDCKTTISSSVPTNGSDEPNNHNTTPQLRGHHQGPSSPSASGGGVSTITKKAPNNNATSTHQPKVVVDTGVDRYLASLLRSANPTDETLNEAALTVKKRRGNGEGALSAHTIRAFHALSPEPTTRKSRMAAAESQANGADSHQVGVFKKGSSPQSQGKVTVNTSRRNQRPTPGAMSKADMDEMSALFHGDGLKDDTYTPPFTNTIPDVISTPGPVTPPPPQSRRLAPLPSNSPIVLKYTPPLCIPQTTPHVSSGMSSHQHQTSANNTTSPVIKGGVIPSSIAEEIYRLVNDPRPFVDWRPDAMRISTVFANRLQRLLYLKHPSVLAALDIHIRLIKRDSAQEVFGSCITDTSIRGLLGTPGSLEFILRHEVIKISMLHGAHEDGVILGTRASSTSHKVVRIPLAIHAVHISEDVLFQQKRRNNKPTPMSGPAGNTVGGVGSGHQDHDKSDVSLLSCRDGTTTIPSILETQLTSILLRPVQEAIHELYDACCRGVSTAIRHRAHPHLSPLLLSSLCRRIYKMVFVHFTDTDIMDLVSLEMPTIFFEHSSSTSSLWNCSEMGDDSSPFQHLRNIKMTRNEFVRWISLIMMGWCERGTISECLLVLRTVRFLWQDLLFQPLDTTLLHHIQTRQNEHHRYQKEHPMDSHHHHGKSTISSSSRPPLMAVTSSLVPILPSSALISLQALLLFTTEEVARSLSVRYRSTPGRQHDDITAAHEDDHEVSMVSSTEEILAVSRHQQLLEAVLHTHPHQRQQQVTLLCSQTGGDEEEIGDAPNRSVGIREGDRPGQAATTTPHVTPSPTKRAASKLKQSDNDVKRRKGGGVYSLQRSTTQLDDRDIITPIRREVSPLGIKQAIIPPTSHGDLMLAKWLMKRLPPVTITTNTTSMVPTTMDVRHDPSMVSGAPSSTYRLPPISPTHSTPPLCGEDGGVAPYHDNQRRTISTPLVDAVRQRSLHYSRFSKYALESRGTYSLSLDD